MKERRGTGKIPVFGTVSVRRFSHWLRATWQRSSATLGREIGTRFGAWSRGADGDPERIPAGAGRVIAIDTVPGRLTLAREVGAETLDFIEEDIHHGDTASRNVHEHRSPSRTAPAIRCCRNFGVASIVGIYGGFVD